MGCNSNTYEEIMKHVDLQDIESYSFDGILADPKDPVWEDIMGEMSAPAKALRKKVVYDTIEEEDRVKEVNRKGAQKSRDAKIELDRLRDLEKSALLLEVEELEAFKAQTVDFMSNNGMGANFLTIMELLSGSGPGM
jgi:hypothetical protein